MDYRQRPQGSRPRGYRTRYSEGEAAPAHHSGYVAKARRRVRRLRNWRPPPGSYLTAADFGVSEWPS